MPEETLASASYPDVELPEADPAEAIEAALALVAHADRLIERVTARVRDVRGHERLRRTYRNVLDARSCSRRLHDRLGLAERALHEVVVLPSDSDRR